MQFELKINNFEKQNQKMKNKNVKFDIYEQPKTEIDDS